MKSEEPKNPEFEKKYKVGRTLGEGTFGKVKIATLIYNPELLENKSESLDTKLQQSNECGNALEKKSNKIEARDNGNGLSNSSKPKQSTMFSLLRFFGRKLSECDIDIKSKERKQFAVKLIKKEGLSIEELRNLENEVNILGACKHPNIVQLIEAYDSSSLLIIVTELCTGGELYDRICEMGPSEGGMDSRGRYTEGTAIHYIYQINEALDYIHGLNVIHRDLKPENLLLANKSSNPPLKLCDFGLAVVFQEGEKEHATVGTANYIAPELLARKGYDQKVDMWALGVISYILLCGFLPFEGESTLDLFRVIRKAEYKFPSPHWDPVSPMAKDFVRRLLKSDPNQRMSTKDVKTHPFITNWLNVKKKINNNRRGRDTKTSGDLKTPYIKDNKIDFLQKGEEIFGNIPFNNSNEVILPLFVEEMKKHNGRRKFRAHVRTVMTTNMMVRETQVHTKSGQSEIADMEDTFGD